MAKPKINPFKPRGFKRPKSVPNIWRTKDGRVYLISEMGDNHIKNCIGYIERNFKNKKKEMEDQLKKLEDSDMKTKGKPSSVTEDMLDKLFDFTIDKYCLQYKTLKQELEIRNENTRKNKETQGQGPQGGRSPLSRSSLKELPW